MIAGSTGARTTQVSGPGIWLPGGVDPEWILTVLSVSMVLLVAIAFVFGLTTVLLRYRNDRTASRLGEAERFWTPLILDALQDPDAIQELAAAVPARDRQVFLRILLRLAVRIRGIERVRTEALARPHLHIEERRLRHGRPEQRALAVRTLGMLDPAGHRESILRALDDHAPIVAMTAARVLARPDDPEALVRVLGALGRFDEWSRGFLASVLLGGGVEGAPVLRDALADPGLPPRLRAVAAEALTRLDDPGAADVAARVVGTTSDVGLRVTCLHLLAETGRPQHLPLLRELTSDEAFAVRAAALRALGRIGGRTDLSLLMEGMADSSPWAALRAAQALLAAGGRHLLEEIAEQGADPRSVLARQALLEAGVLE